MHHSIEPNTVIDTQSESGYVRFLLDEAIEMLSELQVKLNPDQPAQNSWSIQPAIETCADATNLLRNVQRKMLAADKAVPLAAAIGGEDE